MKPKNTPQQTSARCSIAVPSGPAKERYWFLSVQKRCHYRSDLPRCARSAVGVLKSAD